MGDKKRKKKRPKEFPPHGNTKYRFDQLTDIGTTLLFPLTTRSSISSCLKNYNKKHGTGIKVSTRQTPEGLWVQRTA
jgi:hypothetical protein